MNQTYLWHLRLGRINLRRIQRLVQNGPLGLLKVEALPVCESCLEGKMLKMPFTDKEYRAKELLELVYFYLCEPMIIRSKREFEYFITFINDYSRYRYIYLMHHKSKSFEKFKEYTKETKKCLGQFIKTLHLVVVTDTS